jgi:hypothetical protein
VPQDARAGHRLGILLRRGHGGSGRHGHIGNRRGGGKQAETQKNPSHEITPLLRMGNQTDDKYLAQ